MSNRTASRDLRQSTSFWCLPGWLLVVLLTSGTDSLVTLSLGVSLDKPQNGNEILSFFAPPPEWVGDFGAFRSPLLFRDGAQVRNAQEWQTRRVEILEGWHHVLGPWPELIAEPQLETLSESRRENLIQRRVSVPLAIGQREEGWLIVPEGAGRRPAVLVVYYEPETSVGLNPAQPHRDFALQLSRRGFITLSVGTPGGNAWKPELRQAQCQPLSYHAYVAANIWGGLSRLPEVDSERIGVMGHSYGGKWALFAGALWDRFAAVAVSDPGIVFDEKRSNVNYWEPWYLGLDPRNPRPRAGVPTSDNPRTGAYKTLVDRGWDLHELHALIAPRPFFVSGGAEDPPSRWAALNHAVSVNALLGYTNRVGMTSRREHAPDPTSNGQLIAFFETFLKSR